MPYRVLPESLSVNVNTKEVASLIAAVPAPPPRRDPVTQPLIKSDN